MFKYLIFDTETTGLNIITDKPFIIQYGLVNNNLDLLGLGILDVNNPNDIDTIIQLIKQTPTLVGHNIKYDVHMLIDIGLPIGLFADKNYIDTQVLARLVIPHDKQTEGSFKTGLKALAVRYLGINSADEEHKLKLELSRLVLEHKQKMRQAFIDANLWPTMNRTKDTQMLNEIYNNWNKVFHKYTQLKITRQVFLNSNPAPTYKDVSNVRTYALTDIKLTYGLLKLWYPKIVQLQQIETCKRVSEATFPLILMERTGLTVNLQQILNDRNILLSEYKKCKIIDSRNGEELKIGQHAKLQELYQYESGIQLTNADKETRDMIQDKSPSAQIANYMAKMDKYLSTYITGVLNKLTVINNEYKIFTQYNLAGTITGRLSSDFQQFPKEPLMLQNGHEINIRSWFIVPQQNKYMFYFDYSQMELRLQCEWTNIINGTPDLNMVRAFEPYQCTQLNGKWYLNEDLTKEWKPTDLHALTAKHAFPNIDETNPDWAHYRALGKRTNFAVNYGASAARIQEALKVDFTTAQALVSGYKQAFAGVVAFGKWINRRVYTSEYTPNLLLRKYYSRNKHQLQNWLVQGSGADILLVKLREVYNYIRNKPHWQFMISVHDEIGFTCKDIPETQLQQEVKEIKNLMTYELSAVDIIADVEYTQTNWADKEDWNL